MDNRKETLSVMMYLYNKWSLYEAQELFGEGEYGLGYHMWNKWLDFDRNPGKFICELDSKNYDKLIERACSLYEGRKNK